MTTVKYTGTFLDASGYAEANRNFIVALAIAGVDVTTDLVTQQQIEFSLNRYGWKGHLCAALQNRQVPYKISIIHLTPDSAVKYLEKGKYHIFHLFWETDRLPKGWVEACNQANEIWTASEAQAQMIKSSGVTVPIYAFPQPVNVLSIGRSNQPYKIPNFTGFMFYSIFQWIERKNPEALVKTYLKTFSGIDDVALVLKTYRVNYSNTEFEAIKQEVNSWRNQLGLPHNPKIFLVKKLMPTEQITRLHQSADCFVSTTHGEGWGIPAVEAMLSGKPVISIDKTGVADCLPFEMYYPCKTSFKQAVEQPWIPYYTSDQKWLEIDEKSLSTQMMRVYNNRSEAQTVGSKAKQFVIENFNYQTIGQAMKERLQEIERFL